MITFSAYGGGHYVNIVQNHFDFHGEGEFLLMELHPERSQLQVLKRRVVHRRYSVHVSCAFGEPGRFAYQVSLVFNSQNCNYDKTVVTNYIMLYHISTKAPM